MPQAIPVIAAAFASVSAAITTVSAVTVLGITVGTWATIGSVALAGATALSAASAAKKAAAGLASQGQQLDLKVDVNAPVPFVLGRTATGGYIVDQWVSGAKNSDANFTVVLSGGGPIEGVEKYRAEDYDVTWSGDPASGSQATVAATSPASELYQGKLKQAWFKGASTDGQQLTGLAHVRMTAVYDSKRLPQGIPKSLWTVKGLKLWDPRKDSTFPGGSGSQRWGQPATYGFSENPFIHALNYALGYYVLDGASKLVKLGGIGAAMADIDLSAFLSGANMADANGFKVGGVVTSEDGKFAVLNAILAAGSGEAVVRGASISCIFNAPKTVVDTITHDDLADTVEIVNTASWRDRKNRLVPRYRAESAQWQVVTGNAVAVPSWVTDDGNEVRTTEVTYDLVQDAAQASKLAAYDLVNTREFLSFNIVGKPRLLNVRVGDCVTVNLPGQGINGQKCLVTAREFDPATYRVKLALRSETDTKHAWALGLSDIAPTTPSLGFDPANPPAPANAAWGVVGTTVVSPSGVEEPAIRVTGACDDPNAATIIFEYRRVGDVPWTAFAELPTTTTKLDITGVSAGVQYEVAVSYRTVRGVIASNKLILGPVMAGAFVIPWANGVITGVPLSLTDLINGYLQAKYIQFEGKVIPQVLSDYANTVTEVTNNVIQLEQAVANASLTGAAKREELDQLAYGVIQNVLDDVAEEVERKRLTYLDGVEVGSVVRNEVTRTDDLVATVDLIGVKNANGTAFVLNTDKVQVGNGVSMASRFTGLEAATANATAFTTQQFNAMANTVAAEANARLALASTVANNAAVANQQLSTLSNTTTALSQFTSTLGALTANGTAIALDTSKVQVSPGVSMASRDSSIDAKFNGTSSSYLLTTASAASSSASSAVTTLQQMGATLNNGSAFRMDSTKIDVSGYGTLAQTVSSLQSQVNNRATSADVSTQITAATGPGSSLASQITNVSTTANGASSNAQLALSAANGNSAQAVLTVGVGGKISGFKVNGSTGTFDVIASRFSITDNSGATPIVPFVYSGGEVYIPSAIVQRLAANVITAAHIQTGTIVTDNLKDNSVTVPTITSASNTVFGSGFGQSILSQYVPLTKAGQVSATAAIAQHFPSGTRNWSFDLYINGSLVYRCYGANGQDSIALAGALYCPAGNILVEIIWIGQNSGVNIDYRSLTCSGNMK
jgi:hypothetical protein